MNVDHNKSHIYTHVILRDRERGVGGGGGRETENSREGRLRERAGGRERVRELELQYSRIVAFGFSSASSLEPIIY